MPFNFLFPDQFSLP